MTVKLIEDIKVMVPYRSKSIIRYAIGLKPLVSWSSETNEYVYNPPRGSYIQQEGVGMIVKGNLFFVLEPPLLVAKKAMTVPRGDCDTEDVDVLCLHVLDNTSQSVGYIHLGDPTRHENLFVEVLDDEATPCLQDPSTL